MNGRAHVRVMAVAGALLVALIALAPAETGHAPSLRTMISTSQSPDTPRKAVVVELFTSEGCSDCPPADTLLRELEAKQPISGVRVIPLGFHVDYWDFQGWRDRFDSRAYSQRQEWYGERFQLQSIYTPQIVVDGRNEMVGNDGRAVQHALQQAAERSKADVKLQRAATGDEVQVDVANAAGADVWLVITESDLESSVNAGENHGKELRHTAVVRWIKQVGSTKDGALHGAFPVKVDAGWKKEHLHVVALAQKRGQGEIVGAATMALQ